MSQNEKDKTELSSILKNLPHSISKFISFGCLGPNPRHFEFEKKRTKSSSNRVPNLSSVIGQYPQGTSSPNLSSRCGQNSDVDMYRSVESIRKGCMTDKLLPVSETISGQMDRYLPVGMSSTRVQTDRRTSGWAIPTQTNQTSSCGTNHLQKAKNRGPDLPYLKYLSSYHLENTVQKITQTYSHAIWT